MSKIRDLAGSAVSASQLVLFRVIFGLCCGVELWLEWQARQAWVESRPIHFPHLGFEWLGLLPAGWGLPFLCLQGVFCLGMTLGLCYRICTIGYATGYAWMLLVDRAYFNNHFYLICLLAIWLAFCRANCRLALDSLITPRIRAVTVPGWQIYGIILQLGLVYFFGGLAKVNPDWLNGEPMHFFLLRAADHPFLCHLADNRFISVVMAWGGMVFDFLIIPALLWQRTRWLGFAAMVAFHTLNANLFTIGIFPYLSLGTLVLFLPSQTTDQIVACVESTCCGWFGRSPQSRPAEPNTSVTAVVCGLLVVWFALQIAVPLRRFLLPGNVGWTREGYYFAWTMMLDSKAAYLGLHFCDPKSGYCKAIRYADDLNWVQRRWLPGEPRGIAEYARFFAARASAAGATDFSIVCDSVASLNGRPFQYMIDPAVDPAEVSLPRLTHAHWIVPLDREAPIGNYIPNAAQEQSIAPMLEDVRIEQGVFPWSPDGKRP